MKPSGSTQTNRISKKLRLLPYGKIEGQKAKMAPLQDLRSQYRFLKNDKPLKSMYFCCCAVGFPSVNSF